ncbi:MAG: penicillin-binding protein 2, partial [Rikenellaceae bacterium]
MDFQNNIGKVKKTVIKRSIHQRSISLFIFFVLLAILFVWKILYLQYSELGTKLREDAQSIKNIEPRIVKASRGTIKTHNGKTLATTVPTYHLYMDFRAGGLDSTKFFSNVDELATRLADFFKDKPASSYQSQLKEWYKEGYRYKKVSPRRFNYVELTQILTFPLLREGRNRGGWTLDTLQNRERPYGALAARTIGSINSVGVGFGIEGSLDSILAGTDGISKFQKISGTFWIPVEDSTNIEAIRGLDIVSTLDAEVQHVAEEILRKQLEDNSANWGTAILMEVETGEIRALANLGKLDNGGYADIFNYAIGQKMEPGSTFKLVSLMTLLEDAGVKLSDEVDCGTGYAKVGITDVRDTKIGGYGKITLGRAFEVSSNIGFAKMVYDNYQNNPSKFTDFIHSRKFDESYDFELMGATSPYIINPSKKEWNGKSLVMMSYGYAVMTTPLQTLAIYNSIANDGTYIKPKIVKGYTRGDEIVYTSPVDTIHSQVCSPSNIKNIRATLENVVNDGTAKVLLNPYYKVSGKTGTAQVSNGKYGYHYNGGRNYLATMVGYFPAENPKYSCIVAIELFHKDGTNSPYYGGVVSGPVFRAIADKVYSQAVEWGNNIQPPTHYVDKNTTSIRDVTKDNT